MLTYIMGNNIPNYNAVRKIILYRNSTCWKIVPNYNAFWEIMIFVTAYEQPRKLDYQGICFFSNCLLQYC